MSEATLALMALGGFSALSAVDAVLARYYLPGVQSGYYVAASTAAQIAFALPATIALMAYPRFVAADREGGAGKRVLVESVILVGVLGFLSAAVLSAFPQTVVSVLFGSRYTPAAPTLRILAWEGVALGLIGVLVYFHLGRRMLVACASWVGVAGAAVLVAGTFHSSQLSIALVMLVVCCGTLLIMAIPAALTSKTAIQVPLPALSPHQDPASSAS
jgi:O-antigen/teichoic acid export membrane protein